MKSRNLALHAGLLVLTFITVTFAGVQWLNKDPFELGSFTLGLTYGLLVIAFLTAHEMGHYIAARIHGVETTLPYFIPFPPFFGFMPFGTLGAVIRLRSELRDRKTLFDVGSAGPISGFIVCIFVLFWGMTHLPSIEYLYNVHPEYRGMAQLPSEGLTFGKPLLYKLMELLAAPSSAFLPPMNEVYHYPFLCVGWFGAFVTALNLLPIGQLDGGHIAYAMFGSRSHHLSQLVLVVLMLLGTAGILPLLGVQFAYGWAGWLMWSVVLALLLRNKRFRHPPIEDVQELGTTRELIGWLCVIIFILTFIVVPVSP
jgi:membrane-associated protease RseP (regulator of RpoE activity)